MELEIEVDADSTSSYRLPALYATDKKGKRRVWIAWAHGNMASATFGIVGGKMRTTTKAIKGKNVGRVNETSPPEQALLETDRAWVKKLDKAFRPDPGDAAGVARCNATLAEKDRLGGVNHGADAVAGGRKQRATHVKKANLCVDHVERPVLPMHASKWEAVPKCKKCFDWTIGVYGQGKLDGVRCAARLQDGTVVLTSRSGKQFPWFAALRADLKTLLEAGPDPTIILDGEIYCHAIRDAAGAFLPSDARFRAIQSAAGLRRTDPSEYDDQMALHVFDVIDEWPEQGARLAALDALFVGASDGLVHLVPTEVLHSADDIQPAHNRYLDGGYEGIILRAHDLRYKLKHRSLRMRKHKAFHDAEFPILDGSPSVGTEEGCVVWTCAIPGAAAAGSKRTTFNVRPRGTVEERCAMYRDREAHIGALLTVRYQELTAEGCPRFPVGISIRQGT